MRVSFVELYNHMADVQIVSELERRKNDNRYNIAQLLFNKAEDSMTVYFTIYPTYNTSLEVDVDNQPIDGLDAGTSSKTLPPHHKSKPDFYTVIIKCFEISSITTSMEDLVSDSPENQMNTLKTILRTCPVRFYSDDPSYIYQGMWYECEKYDVHLYKLKPEIKALDTGKWRTKANFDSFRVPKHVGALAFQEKQSNRVSQLISNQITLNNYTLS